MPTIINQLRHLITKTHEISGLGEFDSCPVRGTAADYDHIIIHMSAAILPILLFYYVLKLLYISLINESIL